MVPEQASQVQERPGGAEEGCGEDISGWTTWTSSCGASSSPPPHPHLSSQLPSPPFSLPSSSHTAPSSHPPQPRPSPPGSCHVSSHLKITHCFSLWFISTNQSGGLRLTRSEESVVKNSTSLNCSTLLVRADIVIVSLWLQFQVVSETVWSVLPTLVRYHSDLVTNQIQTINM